MLGKERHGRKVTIGSQTLLYARGLAYISCNSQGHVTTLSLVQNNLQGSIPKVIGDLNELKSLQLNQNKISGALPIEIGFLNKLRTQHNCHAAALCLYQKALPSCQMWAISHQLDVTVTFLSDCSRRGGRGWPVTNAHHKRGTSPM